jgi:uncharacterized Zn finger protein
MTHSWVQVLSRLIMLYNMVMSSQQKTIASFLDSERIQALARPSNFRYGKAIHDRGGVEFIESSPSRVEAWVGGLEGSVVEGGSQRRRTRLFVTDKGLRWHCAESAKKQQIFCKHCVALALAILNKKEK